MCGRRWPPCWPLSLRCLLSVQSVLRVLQANQPLLKNTAERQQNSNSYSFYLTIHLTNIYISCDTEDEQTQHGFGWIPQAAQQSQPGRPANHGPRSSPPHWSPPDQRTFQYLLEPQEMRCLQKLCPQRQQRIDMGGPKRLGTDAQPIDRWRECSNFWCLTPVHEREDRWRRRHQIHRWFHSYGTGMSSVIIETSFVLIIKNSLENRFNQRIGGRVAEQD